MNDEFELLTSFLENFEPEVSGHASEPVSDATAALIEKMARGGLTEAERIALAPVLASNERALGLLVGALQRGGA